MGSVTRLHAAVRILLATFLAAGVGACASDDDASEETVGSDLAVSTTAPPTGVPTSTGAPTTTARGSVGGQPPTSAPRPSPGAPVTTTVTGGSSAGSGGAPAADDGRRGPPGSYARTLLRPAPVTSIAVEVITQTGTQLRTGTVALVEDVLEDVSRKEVSVTVRTAAEGAPSGPWDEASILAFADRHGQQSAAGDRGVLRFLALRGGFGPDENAIGVAVRGDVFAVFVERINGATTPLVDAATIEQAVSVHEVGHILGLVDIAIDRNRDDPDHPFHSRNRGSVMFWAIETDLVGQILNGPPPRTFDADDLDDLGALRAGS